MTTTTKGTSKDQMKNQNNQSMFKMQKRVKMKYAGKMKTNIDPLEYQKQLRDEWE